jgi:hypothetical protein
MTAMLKDHLVPDESAFEPDPIKDWAHVDGGYPPIGSTPSSRRFVLRIANASGGSIGSRASVTTEHSEGLPNVSAYRFENRLAELNIARHYLIRHGSVMLKFLTREVICERQGICSP